jgi:hypothetical protein
MLREPRHNDHVHDDCEGEGVWINLDVHRVVAQQILGRTACTPSCTSEFSRCGFYHGVMKADAGIPVKHEHPPSSPRSKTNIETRIGLDRFTFREWLLTVPARSFNALV